MLYGRRQGRALKDRKKILLETLLPEISLMIEAGKLSCPISSGYEEIWLEIGFGNGEHLAYLAEKHPHVLMVGCEPFLNGVGTFLGTIEDQCLKNVRIFTDAAQILLEAWPSHSISKIFLLFPDPWPKKRHHKRRFVNPPNLALLERVLKKEGELLFATDHLDYREWALDVFSQYQGFDMVYEGFDPPTDWVQTRFQEKGLQEGNLAYFVQMRKKL